MSEKTFIQQKSKIVNSLTKKNKCLTIDFLFQDFKNLNYKIQSGYLMYYGENHKNNCIKLRNQYYEITKISFEGIKNQFLYFYFRNPELCLCSKKQFCWSFSSFFKRSFTYDFDYNFKIIIRSIYIFTSLPQPLYILPAPPPQIFIPFVNNLHSAILHEIGNYLSETDLRNWMLSNIKYYKIFIHYYKNSFPIIHTTKIIPYYLEMLYDPIYYKNNPPNKNYMCHHYKLYRIRKNIRENYIIQSKLLYEYWSHYDRNFNYNSFIKN